MRPKKGLELDVRQTEPLHQDHPAFLVAHDAIGIMGSLATAAAMSALYLQIRMAERPSLDVALLLGMFGA